MKQGIWKRIFALLCTLVLAAPLTLSARAAGSSFTDVKPGDWYYDMVTEMVDQGMISGFPDGSFQPNRPISRVEVTAIALQAFPDAALQMDYDPEAALAEIAQINPGFWGNRVIRDGALRGISIFGLAQADWNQPATRGEVAGILVKLYSASQSQPLEAYEEAALLIGDYDTAVAGHDMELPILWLYSNGIVSGTNERGDFVPEGSCTRAEACAMLRSILHPENWVKYDWEQVLQDHENQSNQPAAPMSGVDFCGQTRVRYPDDVAYDYCRELEKEIGIQIFYLPEWTEKDSGLLHYGDMESFPKDRDYFQYVRGELEKMKAAFDRYPDGFLKEVVDGKNNRKAEIILCPYTFEGLTSYGVHVYDSSGDAQKVDQIYYTGVGDSQYYSHEMGHMVMSSMAIRRGWNTTCQAWEDCSQSAADYVSAYAMSNRPEDWAETWAYLWHQTDAVGQRIRGGASGLEAKVELLTQMMDQYRSVDITKLPWYGLL